MKNYSEPEVVEVGPAEEFVLGRKYVNELDVPTDNQFYRPEASVADAD